MKATLTNINKRISVKKSGNIPDILNYDDDNAYPQRMINIVDGSGVATACLNMYIKFIMGGGFEDSLFFKSKINYSGMTTDKLLRKIAKSIAYHNGFALHINYNALFEITEINFVPFYFCRLTDPEGKQANKCAVYPDWDRQKKASIDPKRIQYVDFYNATPDIIQEQVTAAGGWEKYKGQIYYWTANGNEYPLTIYDSILEDIQTDGEIKLFKFRNITTNFMASHILYSPPVEENNKTEWMQTLEEFQGGDNTAKIMNIETTDQSKFKLEKVEIQSVDDIFSYTERSVKENIVRQFNIPPVLMGILQSGKLGTAKEIQDATEFFNGITAPERLIVEEVFVELIPKFSTKINTTGNFKIIPYKNPVADTTIEQEYLQYFTPNEIRESKGYSQTPGGDLQHIIDTLGMKGVTAISTILANESMTPKQKADTMVEILGISQDSANKMAGINADASVAPQEKLLAQTLGVGGTQAMMTVLSDTKITPAQKANIMMIVFGRSQEDANKLAGI